jgi:hypothetical protein
VAVKFLHTNVNFFFGILISYRYLCTVNSISDYTLWTLYRFYFKGISANIELQVYSVTCCSRTKHVYKFYYNCVVWWVRTIEKRLPHPSMDVIKGD